MTTPAKRPAHRPPLPEGQRKSAMIRVRVTHSQQEAYAARGGVEWLRRMLDRARV